MSYQIPSQNPSTPPNDTNPDQDYEYAPKSDEPVFIQNKQGFKRRAINSQNNNPPTIQTNEKDDNMMILETQKDLYTEGSPRSAELIVDVSEKSGFMGMSYPGGDDSGMFNLRAIINEAKRSEGRFYDNDGNYGDNENNEMNIMIQDDGQEAEEEEEPERRRFERVPSKIRKTENQGVEIDFTTEESVEKEGTHYLGQEPKTPTGPNTEGLNHSKSSYLSGPVRYSKMPEEEAATIFEQRRKELLGNLVKKGRRKHLRIFQDNVDSNSARAISDINAHSVKAKPTSPGFVIYNTRNPSLNKPRMESPPPSLKKKEEKDIAKSTASTATMRPNALARNTKARAGSSMAANTEKKESAPVLPPSKAQHVQPKIKASSSEARNLMNKRPISSREVPSFFKNQQKKEEPKVIVNLKNTRNNREKRMTIDEIDEPRAPKRETPFSPSELETPQETFETKESAVKASGGAYKNREIWAEIEDLDQQIYELEQAKDIEEVKEFEAREFEVKSGGWKKAKREAPGKREEDEDRREALQSAGERTNSKNTWGRNDENSERRISDRYKLASDDLLIEQDSEMRYSNYINKNEGEDYEDPAVKTLHYGDENLKNSSFAQSYRTFSEKRTTHRHEMLYQKAMEKNAQRQMQHENMKKERELAELRKCTFSPDLMRTNRMEFDEDFNTRARNWQKEKERKIEEIEKKKQEQEMAECTFTPSHNLGKSQISKNEAEEFYRRNLEWKQKVEGVDTKKRDDYLKLVTLSGEKSRNKPSIDNRPTHDSEQNRFIKTQTLFHSGKEPTKKPYTSTSSATNRSYSKKRGEENKTAAQTQPTDVSGLKRFNITKTQKSRTHTAEDDFLKRVEHHKGHSELTESNEILDLLKQVVGTAKSDKGDSVRMKGPSQSPRRKGKSFNPSSSGTLKFDNNKPLDTLTLNTLESTGPVGRSKNVSNDVPFLSTEHTTADLKSNAENIVIKNNKYYITKKLKSPSSIAKNPSAFDSDKKEDIPSLTYTLGSRMKSGSKNESKSQQMRGYSPKRDQENSHVPQKLVYNKQKDIPAMSNLFDEQQSPSDLFRTPLADREMNSNTYESPRIKNNENYGKNRENKEVNPSLEKKFLDLINQVSRVTQQLDQIRPPTAGGSASGGQNENLSSKRRRINFSLY